LIGSRLKSASVYYLIIPLAVLLALREWSWIRFGLPERRIQTEKTWGDQFGLFTASAMWGFHIGLGFATRINNGGFWVLVGIAIAVGEPRYGAALIVTYWLGRALSPGVAFALTENNDDVDDLMLAILADRAFYRRLVGLVLIWSAAISTLLVIQMRPV
jgi:hypothetical protein